MDFEVRLTGLDEFKAKMEFLPAEMQRKTLRFALRKAALVIADAVVADARALDDEATGQQIASNVGVRFASRWSAANPGSLMFRVGIVGGANTKSADPEKRAGAPTPHWRLLEFGTSKMAAQPFFRPAAERAINEAFNTFADEADSALARALRRYSKSLMSGG